MTLAFCANDGEKIKRNKQHKKKAQGAFLLRRLRDSNPRYPLEVYTLSRRAPSTTRTSLLGGAKIRVSTQKRKIFLALAVVTAPTSSRVIPFKSAILSATCTR
jgi:hypothetical protein